MLKKIKLIYFISILSVAITACTGEDGEIGPMGEPGVEGEKGDKGDKGDIGDGLEKVGSLTGTITGTRRDGTPFTKNFSYEYAIEGVVAFSEEYGRKHLDIYRYSGGKFNDFFDLELVLEDGTLKPSDESYSTYFTYKTEENASTLFSLRASAYYEDTESKVTELLPELNETYQFSQNSDGHLYQNDNSIQLNGVLHEVSTFYSSYNSGNYSVYYRKDNGTLLGVADAESGILFTSGTLFDYFNNLRFTSNVELGFNTFFDAATDEDLSYIYPFIPADEFTVTNYNHDPETGILSFNFTLQISGDVDQYYRENTTQNDLTITGTYNSGVKVYANTVGRTKNN